MKISGRYFFGGFFFGLGSFGVGRVFLGVALGFLEVLGGS